MPQVHLNTTGVEVQFCRSKKLPCRLQIAAMATKALRSLQTFSSQPARKWLMKKRLWSGRSCMNWKQVWSGCFYNLSGVSELTEVTGTRWSKALPPWMAAWSLHGCACDDLAEFCPCR